MLRSRALSIICAVIGLGLTAPTASALAQTYYAAPSGSGDCSTASTPCSLKTAVGKAQQVGDKVSVAPGGYDAGALSIAPGVIIAGPAAPGAPVVQGSLALGAGATAQFLHLVHASGSPALTVADTATAENLLIETTRGAHGGFDIVQLHNAIFRDSVVWTHPGVSQAIGVHEFPSGSANELSHLRNLTVWVPGSGSVGLFAAGTCADPPTCTSGTTGTIDARNVVVRGDPGGYDLVASGGSTGPTEGSIAIDHSNYRSKRVLPFGGTIVAGPGNQDGSDPRLADPSAGDFHPRPGSPLVDAGLLDGSTGTQDLDGYLRVTPPLPDIGAYERPLAPSATTGSASAGATFVVMNGSFDSQGRPARAYFELGANTRYGQRTSPRQFSAALGSRDIAASLHELWPGRVYHYRLVVVAAGAVARGADRTVRTNDACIVPNLRQMSLSRAKRALSHARCRLGHVTRGGGRHPVVVAQRPSPDTIRPVGAKVNVKIAGR